MPPPQVMSNVPHGNASGPSTTTDSTGPVLLGEPMQRRRDFVQRLAPTTGDGVESASVVTNGIHPSHDDLAQSDLTNGAPSNGYQEDVEGDTPMGGVESLPTSNDKANDTQKTHTTASFGNRESAQPRPLHSWTAPSQHLLKESGMSAPRSQTGPFTPMPQGSHPADLQNDASTTETPTEKKTSSGDMDQNNQQDSGPNLFLLEERRSAGGSQIPSTQGNMAASQDLVDPLSGTSTGAGHARPSSSQGQGQETSSQPPVPAFDAADREGRRLSRSNGPADMQE
ncbi:TAT-binding protein-like protein 7, AAA ATPase, partial [Exophiala xenobiotica]